MMPKTGTQKAIPKPRQADADWFDRIQRAKDAREQSQKAREGKPATFSLPRTIT
jgi:hypothetical protein